MHPACRTHSGKRMQHMHHPRRMQDGRNWARIEADHHTHALFDRGEAGEWDALHVAAPQVLAAGPRDMRLWYHSYDVQRRRFRVGLATSEDGFKCAPGALPPSMRATLYATRFADPMPRGAAAHA